MLADPQAASPIGAGVARGVDELRDRLVFLPPAIVRARRWLVWTAGKVPHYPDGAPRYGTLDAPHDTGRLGTLEAALAALDADPRFLGLGFALGFDAALGAHWQGLDLDDALDAGGRFATDMAGELYGATEGYAERSPSGHGLHVLGLGAEFRSIKWKRLGEQAVELYARARFLTMTGRMMREGDPEDLAPLAERTRARLGASGSRVRRTVAAAAAAPYLDRMPAPLRAWIEAHPIEPALAAHGYKRNADRWLSPHSTSGVPGVVVADRLRAVTFHASDTGLGCEVDGDAEVFNAFDLAVRDRFGGDRTAALRALLPANAPESPAEEAAARFRLLTADELATLPPVRWRVRGVLPEAGLAALYGPSGSGKSFLLLDLLGAVAEGCQWFGHRVEPCAVTYIALEGEAGVQQRVDAYRGRHGAALAGARFMVQPFALLVEDDAEALARAIVDSGGGGGIVAIDTLNRAAGATDENDARDMARIIDAAKRLQRAVGGLVLVVHHTGKDATRGLRGHSSLHAALDAVVEVTRDGEARSWRLAKSKDGADGQAHGFRLATLALGTDAEGEPVTSCVVEPVAAAATRARPLTPAQLLALVTLTDAASEAGELTEAGELRGVHVEAWREAFHRRSTADTPEAKKKAFQRGRTDLQAGGLVTVEFDYYCPTDPAQRATIVAVLEQRDSGTCRDIGGTHPGESQA